MTVVIIGAIMSIATAATLMLSTHSLKNAHGRVDWNRAFYNAESAVVWAAQNILDTPPAPGSSNWYSTAAGTLPVAAIVAAAEGDTSFKGTWVSVVQPATTLTNVFVITASARVNDKVHSVQATITARPVSVVFDYEYFLNNWGWWWGASIVGNGAQRANWDFDFKGGPQVNGSIYAADHVEENEIPYNQYTQSPPFGGLAGADPLNLVHQGAPRVAMPNLLNFSNYIAAAMSDPTKNGIWLGSTQIVAGVQNDPTQTGLYLASRPGQPITINGTVVIPGDLVIKGTITGKGTLYVGGDLYIADNISYANGPSFSPPPETLAPAMRDQWVQQSMTNDLVGFAVKGSIFAGDVTDSDWINWCYWYPGSGLAYVGDESHLGVDGIADTPDDNIPFLHPDGTMSTWYDADGDGKVQGNYKYSTDINMNSARASKILGYPTDDDGNPLPYKSVATDNMGTLDGIFYTDHAAAMRLARSTSVFHGAIISRNEQIVYQSHLNLNYDSRVHSRYHNNPNQFINLGLPWGNALQVNNFVELPPITTNL
jgi:hypothetical protein